MKRYVVNSLHTPIEIEIDGQKVSLRAVTLGDLATLEQIDEKSSVGSVRDLLASMIIGDSTIVDKIPLIELQPLITHIVRVSTGGQEETEEKNVSGPGLS